MTKLRRSFLVYLLIGAVLAVVAWQFIDTSPSRTRIPLDRYEASLADGKVESATLLDKDHEVRGDLKNGTKYEVKFPEGYTEQITTSLVAADVKFDVDSQKDSAWVGLLLGWLPFILLIGIILFVLSRVQGGGRIMGFGKSRAKTVTKDQPKTTFEDVAGLDEAVVELQEIKEFGPAQDHLRGRRRPRRGGGGAPGDQGVPRGAGEVPRHRGEDSQGRPPLRSAGHGQDPARQGGRG